MGSVAPWSGHHSKLVSEIARLKILHVIEARYWIPDKEEWMKPGRTCAEIITKVDLCGVWLGGPKE